METMSALFVKRRRAMTKEEKRLLSYEKLYELLEELANGSVDDAYKDELRHLSSEHKKKLKKITDMSEKLLEEIDPIICGYEDPEVTD